MLWGLFNSPPDELKRAAVIHERGGTFPIDLEYAALGESEGWLVFIGWETDAYNVMISQYEYRPD